jgi:branched-chain amino acid transport system substrate-binding protein
MLRRILLAALAATAFACQAPAQDAYLVGVTEALTGPPGLRFAAAIEGLRLYVDRLNAAGGVNGKKIQLVVLDDQAEPSKAAANAKRLLTENRVSLLILSSLSSTYAPVIAEAKRAGVPLLFAGGVCPKEVYPPADPLLFCTTGYAATYDGHAALDFIKETAKEPVRIGFVALAIPVSRGVIDSAETRSKSMGMTPVDKEVIPPRTTDYMPFATKLKDANPNWIFCHASWVADVKTLEALRRIGWEGDYIVAATNIDAEAELARLKDGKFYIIGANSSFQENLAIHKLIRDAAQKGNARYPAEQLTEGWIGGLVLEAVLKGAGWPPDPAKIRTTMEQVKVDMQGLRGGPIEWSKDNHFRTRQYYRVYRWDPAKSAVTVTKDWVAYDVK